MARSERARPVAARRSRAGATAASARQPKGTIRPSRVGAVPIKPAHADAARRAGWPEGRLVWLRSDWGLIIAALGLSLLGAVLVHSATVADRGAAMLVRHLVTVAAGVALATLVTRIDFRGVRAWAPWLYLLGVLGLVAVLTPLGSTVNGSRSWIQLPGGFSLQPAEPAKVALCIGLAMLLAEGRRGASRPGTWDIAGAWILALIPIALILRQPDLGSALVLGVLALVVIAVAGAPWRWTLAAAGAAVAGVIAAFAIPLLSGYQRNRILAFLNPDLDPSGIGYQTTQVRLAIGSGGLTGQGLYQGHSTQGGFIPYQETDFIFSVAGEELGFVGAVGLLLLIGFIILRALWIAAHTTDRFARLVAVGVAAWFAFQTFESVGMNIGLMPVTGLPLPFVSYGGSSMMACWLAIGLLNTAQLTAYRRG